MRLFTRLLLGTGTAFVYGCGARLAPRHFYTLVSGQTPVSNQAPRTRTNLRLPAPRLMNSTWPSAMANSVWSLPTRTFSPA